MEPTPRLRRAFQKRIQSWGTRNPRDFPFRRTQDPYRILVSEILLRRTTARAVSAAYYDFFTRFPSVESLAQARVAEIVKLIRSLGMRRRARDLRVIARIICRDFGGKIPTSLGTLMAFPGVGGYIAGCVVAFRTGESIPLVDSNIERIFSRFFGLPSGPKASPVSRLYAKVMPPKGLRHYHHALIDLAHEVCKPLNPRCMTCPLNDLCVLGQTLLKRPSTKLVSAPITYRPRATKLSGLNKNLSTATTANP
jgi:A/G-specific adenine glycosylase